MALTSIIRDFAVRAGLIVEGTRAVTSSTEMTGTLQVYGGAAIAKNAIIGDTLLVGSDTDLNKNLTVTEGAWVGGLTSTNEVTILSSTQANTSGYGALQTPGGGYFGSNLVVNSSAESTGTLSGNALYVQGGAGIGGSLFVQGEAVFQNDVIFAGTTTYVFSTNTIYTDNILELHYHEGTDTFTTNDGMDIGFRFHFYDTENTNAFLGRDNSTGYLDWYGRAVTEENTGTVEVGEWGSFRTGYIYLKGTESNTTSLVGNVLQIDGGAGVDGDVYVRDEVAAGFLKGRNLTEGRIPVIGPNGRLIDDPELLYDITNNLLTTNIANANTTTHIAGGAQGSIPYQTAPGRTAMLPIGTAGLILASNGSTPYWEVSTSTAAGTAVTATNLYFGLQYQIPFQTGPGATSFEDTLKFNYDTDTLITVYGSFTGTTNATSVGTGALQTDGGLSVAQDAYFGGRIDVANSVDVGQNILVGGSTLGTLQSSFNLLNTTATTVNAFGAATAITLGATSGFTAVRNDTTITSVTAAISTDTGALVVYGGIGIGDSLHVENSANVGGRLTAEEVYATSAGTQLAPNIGLDSTGTIGIYRIGDHGLALTVDPAEASYVKLEPTTGTTVNSKLLVTSSEASNSVLSGAIVTYGGLGVGGNAYIGGNVDITGGNITTDQTTFNVVNNVATTVNAFGAATAITLGAITGYTDIRNQVRVTSVTGSASTDTGAIIVYGGAGIAENLFVGGDVNVTGGDITTDQPTFNLINDFATTINFAGSATSLIVGAEGGSTVLKTLTTVTDITDTTGWGSGALQVRGGVGIKESLWVNSNLNVEGKTELRNLYSELTTSTALNVTGNATVNGTLSVLDTQNANATNNGAIRVSGGIGVVKDMYVGGAVTAGATGAATTGTSVPGFFTNNTLIASYTSNVISGITKVDLDAFSASVYRSARYFVQIVDISDIHISEISVFHDGTKAYINEYGIATNNGQLGTFDADLTGGNISINFTPFGATTMVIKMVRTTMTL